MAGPVLRERRRPAADPRRRRLEVEPEVPADLGDGGVDERVVAPVEHVETVAAERHPEHLAVALPVRPLLRPERGRRHQPLHRLRDEVAAAAAQPIGPVGHGDGHDDDGGVVHHGQPVGQAGRRDRRGGARCSRPGSPARPRRRSSPSTRHAAPSRSTADTGDPVRTAAPAASAAVRGRVGERLHARRRGVEDRPGRRRPALAHRSCGEEQAARPADSSASCGTIARLKRSVSVA